MPVGLERFVNLAAGLERVTQIAEGIGVMLDYGDRAANELHGRVRVADLSRENAKQMQRPRMRRKLREHLAIMRLRLRKSPGTMMIHGQAHRTLQRRGERGKAGSGHESAQSLSATLNFQRNQGIHGKARRATTRLFPVISCGCGRPSRASSVGATSARMPSRQWCFA